MTALAADRLTDQIGIETALLRNFSVAATAKIHAGAIVALTAGAAKAGVTATGLTAVGRAEEAVDNSAGAAGDLNINVMRGIFRYDNDGTDSITAADIGNDCYIVDDQTVAKTDGTATRSVAGRVFDLDADGVWVEFYK